MKLLFALVVVALVVAVALYLSRRRGGTRRFHEQDQDESVGDVLRRLIQERSDYQIFVGLPVNSPTAWVRILRVDDSSVEAEGRGSVPISEIGDYFVAYPNGQLLVTSGSIMPLPNWVTALERAKARNDELFLATDLTRGRGFVSISYGPSSSKPAASDHYSTTLTNDSNEAVRVIRFAAYKKSSRGWRLSTVTGDFFSAGEFVAWYGVHSSGWIQPGESVTDSNNYGRRPVLWAYDCRTKSGAEFTAGCVLR